MSTRNSRNSLISSLEMALAERRSRLLLEERTTAAAERAKMPRAKRRSDLFCLVLNA
jgi:hypothetical protein